MKHYIKLIDDIIISFLKDLKSLRFQLLLMAFAWNLFMFLGKASDAVMITSLAMLTACYTFWFASKHSQAIMENKQSENSDAKD